MVSTITDGLEVQDLSLLAQVFSSVLEVKVVLLGLRKFASVSRVASSSLLFLSFHEFVVSMGEEGGIHPRHQIIDLTG